MILTIYCMLTTIVVVVIICAFLDVRDAWKEKEKEKEKEKYRGKKC